MIDDQMIKIKHHEHSVKLSVQYVHIQYNKYKSIISKYRICI